MEENERKNDLAEKSMEKKREELEGKKRKLEKIQIDLEAKEKEKQVFSE